MKKYVLLSVIWTFCLLIQAGAFVSAARADLFKFVGQITNAHAGINLNAGKAEKFDVSYDTNTKILRWVVTFSAVNGKIPNGFHMVINDGPNPKGYDGELAAFYYDASNMAQPKLSVYAFNGANNFISWQDGSKAAGVQAPDRILSTMAPLGGATNPSGWVKQLIATNHTNGQRTLGFVIDTTRINSHTPRYPSATPGEIWKGAKFGPLLGEWFHPMVGISAAYANAGFLSAFSYTASGWYDGANIPTVRNRPPVCVPQPVGVSYQNLSCDGTTKTVTLDGTQSFDPDLGKNGLSYVWLTDCPGAVFQDQYSVKPTLTYDSLTADGSPVSCGVTLYVVDGELYTQCGATVSTSACLKDCLGNINGDATFDVCGICDGDGSSCLDCADIPYGSTKVDECGVCGGDGRSCLECGSTDIRQLQFTLDNNANLQSKAAIKAAKRLRRVASDIDGVSEFVADVTKEAKALYMDNWTQAWSMPQVLASCNSNSICTTASNQIQINTYNANATALRDLTNKVLKEIRRLKKKKDVKNYRILKKRSDDLYAEAIRQSGTIPATYSVCQ